MRTEGTTRKVTSRGWIKEWMTENMIQQSFLQKMLISSHSSIHMEALMQVFYPDSMFSSTSPHQNTISHSLFPSLPDGPWPSQPYLHRLAGPTSFHSGGLLAGKIHSHSLSGFHFITILFLQQGTEGLEEPQQSYTMSDQMILCGLPVGVCFWCLLLGPRVSRFLSSLCFSNGEINELMQP